jgi:hypothetical protein
MKPKKAIPAQVQPVVSQFHSHLDKCSQCSENPFALCTTGNFLLAGCVSKPMPQEFLRIIDE